MAFIAMDIGGSAIKASVITAEGEILKRMSVATPLESYKALLETLTALVNWGKGFEAIEGIALSQPCATDAHTGTALSEGALIYIKGENPAKDLGAHFGLPYSAENDGNCAALAELWIGSANDIGDMAFIVCGTGIGGALVKDRRIHSGSKNFAGEFGMMFIGYENTLNRPVMWSEIGSTQALVKQYSLKSHQDFEALNGKIVFERAESGDAVARSCIRAFYQSFARGIHNIQHVFDPEVVLIGGGISTRPELLDEINAELKSLYSQFELAASFPVLRRSSFLADGNMIGAVYHHLCKNA